MIGYLKACYMFVYQLMELMNWSAREELDPMHSIINDELLIQLNRACDVQIWRFFHSHVTYLYTTKIVIFRVFFNLCCSREMTFCILTEHPFEHLQVSIVGLFTTKYNNSVSFDRRVKVGDHIGCYL